jgi:hypothetical protein
MRCPASLKVHGPPYGAKVPLGTGGALGLAVLLDLPKKDKVALLSMMMLLMIQWGNSALTRM